MQVLRKSTFATSALLHVLFAACLWLIRIENPIAAPRAHSYSAVIVYTPPPAEVTPPPRRLPAPPVHIEQLVAANTFRAPKILTEVRPKPQLLETPAPVPVARAENIAPAPPAPAVVVAPPPKQVQMGAFTPQLTAAVQPPLRSPAGSAGFEAANTPSGTGPARQVAVGNAFDRVETAGHGAGRRVVTGDAFGSAAAFTQQASNTSVRAGGFGDATVAPAAVVAKRTSSAGAMLRPVEILEKPKPLYTDEARRQSIEGEVVLEALFSSSGHVRVLRTIKGLGHGLDESALHAAEAIRFRPAERDGQPVDFTAAVHISFQLAK